MTKEQAEEAARRMDDEAREREGRTLRMEADGSTPDRLVDRERAEALDFRRAALALRAHWPQQEALEVVQRTFVGHAADAGCDCSRCSALASVDTALVLARKEP